MSPYPSYDVIGERGRMGARCAPLPTTSLTPLSLRRFAQDRRFQGEGSARSVRSPA